MKTNRIFLVMLTASMIIISCKGDKGDLGPVGETGKTSLTKTSVESAGTNCATGGVKIETGLDANNNGILEPTEVIVTQTRYICNGFAGVTGASGANGQKSLIKTSVEAAGGNCANCGVKIEVGVDANNNNVLDPSEIVAALTRYICNGTNGTNGTSGINSLIRTSTEAAGANCTYGGTKFEIGMDANKNGELEDAEVISAQTKFVCNGAGAIYSSWMDIDVEATNPAGSADERQWAFKQFIAAPKLTADILDKGVVLLYLKNSEGVVSLVDRDDVRPIKDVNAGTSYDIYCGFTFRLNEVRFYTSTNTASGTGAEIRYVLIQGLTAGRPIVDFKKMSYEQIAKLYNIK
jgi:hypothetical protein